MTTHVLRSPLDLETLKRLLDSRKLPMTVNVLSGTHRTGEQNRLQRKWCNEAAEQLGDRTAEELRGHCKLHIGVPILRQENGEYAEKYDRLIRPLPYETKLEYMMAPLDFPVTRLMTTKQKTTYLDRVFHTLSAQGVTLTVPPDRRFGNGGSE